MPVMLSVGMGSWLMQTAAVADPLVAQRGGVGVGAGATDGIGLLGVLAIVALVVVALLLIALLVLLLPAIRSFRRASEKSEALLDRLTGDLAPIIRHATSIADNADYISTAVRSNVGEVSRTVRNANERLDEALLASERRIRELGALLRIVQDEVEHTVVSTTSIVRGIRASADALRDRPFDFLETGTLPDSDDEIEETLEEAEETDYGHDWARNRGEGDGQGNGYEERPRIRRRPGR